MGSQKASEKVKGRNGGRKGQRRGGRSETGREEGRESIKPERVEISNLPLNIKAWNTSERLYLKLMLILLLLIFFLNMSSPKKDMSVILPPVTREYRRGGMEGI